MNLKKNYFIVLLSLGLALLFVVSSCNENEFVAEQAENDGFVEILGVNVELKNNTLVLNSESELYGLISKAKAVQSVSTRQTGIGIGSDLGNGILNVDGFSSLNDIYTDAMMNAESYYDREGGYEEFKMKYSALYFPEYGDDYSAYLPVSDPVISYFLNEDGEIIIDGKKVNLKDISTYRQLVELGLTPPEEEISVSDQNTFSATRDGNLLFPGEPIKLEPNKAFKKNNRKIWIHHTPMGIRENLNTAGIEICFRKKGFLGAWYNHWALTKAYVYVGRNGTMVVSRITKDGYSSHDHLFIVNDSFLETEPLNGGGTRKHLFGETQVYYDALKNFTFIMSLHYTLN